MIYVCSLEINNDDIISGKEVITSLSGLYIALANSNCKELEIKKDFANKFFTPSGIDSFIKEAKRLNKFIRINTEEKYDVYFDSRVEQLRKKKTVDEIIEYILRNKNEAVNLIQYLCDHYTNIYSETLVANNKLGIMHLQISEAYNKLENAERARYLTQELMNETRVKLDTLVSRINYTYEKDVNETKLLGVNLDTRKYRKILYIKEVTRVKYTDTFVYYLQEILKTLYSVPARLVIIESAYSYSKADLYPNCVKHTELTYHDVYNSNIFMSGFHPNIMESILQNPSNIDYLIVLDRSGWGKCYITGESVEVVYTVSDLKDVKVFIPTDRILSYSNQTLHIPHIKDFDNLAMEEKISKYSSLDSMKSIIDLIERKV